MTSSKSAQPQRVLQYIGNLSSGGSQTMIMEIYRNIDRSKFQFDFVIDKISSNEYRDEIKLLGGNIFFLPSYKIYNGIFFRHTWNVFFKTHPEYKIIHSHVRTTAAMVLKIAKKYKIKTIAHSHSTSNGKSLKSQVKNFYQRNITKYSDVNIACSHKAGIYLFKKSPFVILKNGIDFTKYAYDAKKRLATRTKLNLTNRSCVICQIGRLIDAKNHFFSINIVEYLTQKKPNIKLLIIGDGPNRQQIQKYIHRKKMEKSIIMLGNRSDIPDILLASDIFIMPSLYEGLPLSLVEAQASNIPCVVSDNIQDGIFNKNVIQLSLDNMDQWRDTLLTMIKQPEARNLDYPENSDFNISTTVKQLEDIYVHI